MASVYSLLQIGFGPGFLHIDYEALQRELKRCSSKGYLLISYLTRMVTLYDGRSWQPAVSVIRCVNKDHQQFWE